MENKIKVELRKEVELNKNFEPTGEEYTFFDETFKVDPNTFENITEEDFYECFEGLRGCVPNETNSSYEDRRINVIIYDDELEDADEAELEEFADDIKEMINDVDKGNFISSIEVDDDGATVFFDIFLDKDISKEELRKLLVALERNI